jgi:hypothetical protein
MPIYTGKFNFKPLADNENIIVDLPDGWVTHGRARVWSTWTKDSHGAAVKSLAFGAGDYVLREVNDGATMFTIRDLDNNHYYWFTGTRNGDSIFLSILKQHNVLCQSNIKLTLHK